MTADMMVQPILQLRKTMLNYVTINNQRHRIVAKIPPFKVVTVNITMSKSQTNMYNAIHAIKTQNMARAGGAPRSKREGTSI